MTIAPTGSGKGVSCIIPTLLHYKGPVIVVDPKGENFAVTAELRRAMGQNVVLLDPFEQTGHTGNRLNPLAHIATLSKQHRYPYVAELMELLMPPSPHQDPFWESMAKSLAIGLSLDIIERSPPALCKLSELRHRLFCKLAEQLTIVQAMEQSTDPTIVETAGLILGASEKTLSSIFAVAQPHIGQLRGEQLDWHFAKTDFNTFLVADCAPLSIYLVIPPNKLKSHSCLLRLWIGMLMERVAPVEQNTCQR